MQPENGANSKFIRETIECPKIDRSFVVKVGSNLRRAVGPNKCLNSHIKKMRTKMVSAGPRPFDSFPHGLSS